MPVPAMRARRGYTYLYMCRHRAAEIAQNAIFFALLVLGFYYYHMLKWQKNACAKTLDDFILNL